MKKITIILLAFMLIIPLLAQDKKRKKKKIDRIFLKIGKVIEGEIESENYKFVKLKGKKPIRTNEIEDIDYYDKPETYTDAMEKLRLMDYKSALGSFKIASKKDIQRPWLKINCLFYQSLCQFHLKEYNICIANIKNLLKIAPKTRFLPEVLELLLECYIKLNNEAECINVLSRIEGLSKELKDEGKKLLTSSKYKFALFLRTQEKYKKAAEIFQWLYKNTSGELTYPCIKAYVECLRESKDIHALEVACQTLLKTQKDAYIKMLATNGIGEAILSRARKDKQKIRDALSYFVKNVVNNYLEKNPYTQEEYHLALYLSAVCYDKLRDLTPSNTQKDIKIRLFLRNMALMSLTDIISLPHSKYATQARKLYTKILQKKEK